MRLKLSRFPRPTPNWVFVVGLVVALVSAAYAENGTDAPPLTYDQIKDIVYHPDVHGVALVMDVFTPRGEKNGMAIVDVASGSWYSDRGKIRDHEKAQFYQIFCGRGYTVFAIRPGSQTRFTGMEMLDHVKRGIRWVRHHAEEYGIDPDRLGLAGASAGGHLASLAAARADDGNPEAKDLIDRESSRVKTVGVFFPPADFTKWKAANAIARTAMKGFFFENSNTVGKTQDDFDSVFFELSPALHIKEDAPPFLIFHGTKDSVVPMEQSELLLKSLQEKGVESKLIIKEGGGHPWPTIHEEVAVMADWFDENLRK